MKPNRILITIALLLLLAVLAGALVFLLSKSSPAPSEQAPFLPTEPQFLEGTFPPSQEPVELSIQGAKEGKTIQLSWDESKVRMFHIVLLNTDWQAIWLLSSVDLGKLPETQEGTSIKRKDVSLFVPSGYVLGDTMEGFQSLDESQAFQLVLGQQYYLQILGFTKEDQAIAVNKKFTFTASCLPPDCK